MSSSLLQEQALRGISAANVLVIAGPTASGKSSFALDLAKRCDGVIINADSMQIYDALPVLTAQPAGVDLNKAPHKLYGILDPADSCNAEQWRSLCIKAIDAAHNLDKTPIVTGGTGFYINALLNGLSPIPDVAETYRQQAEDERSRLGPDKFHDLIKDNDPRAADRIHPNDSQRLVRAREIFLATGQPLTYWQQKDRVGPPDHYKFYSFHISPPRDQLYQRCEARFDHMLDKGILDEVRALSSAIDSGDVPADAAITNALGYTPLRNYLAEKISQDEAVTQAKTDTRRYAKRQQTWFRNQLSADCVISPQY